MEEAVNWMALANSNSTYRKELMKDEYVNVRCNLTESHTIKAGDTITYKGKTFYAAEDYTPQFNISTNCYAYDVKFYANYWLCNKRILKVHPSGKDSTAGLDGEWSVFNTPEFILGIIVENMNTCGVGEFTAASIDDPALANLKVSCTFSGTYIIDALNSLTKACDPDNGYYEWWVDDGNVVHIGKMGSIGAGGVSIGEDAVISINENKSNGIKANRLYAYGSDRNLSLRYRRTFDISITDTKEIEIEGEKKTVYASDKYTITKSMLRSGARQYQRMLGISGLGDMALDFDAGNESARAIEIPITLDHDPGIYTPCIARITSGVTATQTIDTDGKLAWFNMSVYILIRREAAQSRKVYLGSGNVGLTSNNPYQLVSPGTIDMSLSKGEAASLVVEIAIPVGSRLAYHGPRHLVLNASNLQIEVDSKYYAVDLGSAIWNPFYQNVDTPNARVLSAPFSASTTNCPAALIAGKLPVSWFKGDNLQNINGSIIRHLLLPKGTEYVGENNPGIVVEAQRIFEDIYPKMRGTIGECSLTTAELEDGTTWHGYTFKTTLIRDIDENDILTDGIHIVFDSGSRHLGGMDFALSIISSDSEGTTFGIVPAETGTRLVPNETLYPSPSDTFALYGLDPLLYEGDGSDIIAQAEAELLANAQAYYNLLQTGSSTYSIRLAPTFAEAHPLSFGQSVALVSANLNTRVIGVQHPIDLPCADYNIIVGNSLTYRRQDEIEKSIIRVQGSLISMQTGATESARTKSRVGAGATSGTSSTSESTNSAFAQEAGHAQEADHATEADFANELSEEGYAKTDGKYISKVNDDYAEGNITFAQNIGVNGTASASRLNVDNDAKLKGETQLSESYTEGAVGAKFTHPRADNDTKLQLQYLHVTKKATFETLEINHVEHIAGNLVMSRAKATLYKVSDMGGAYRCYFRATDSDGNSMYNTWRADDQAYCCTFDLGQFVQSDTSGKLIASKAGNHYWWRKVTSVSTAQESVDGVMCHWINVSKTDSDEGSDAPVEGDYVVLRGNRSDKNRQGTIELLTAESVTTNTLPAIRVYKGINSYTLPAAKIDMSPERVLMTIDQLKITTGGEDKTVEDYLQDSLDGIIIINGDDANPPTTDATFIAGIIAKAGVSSIGDLVGAIYITTEKMFYRLTRNNGAYSWTEDTDGTLKAWYESMKRNQLVLDQITSDEVIAENERKDIDQILSELAAEVDWQNEIKAAYPSYTTAFGNTWREYYNAWFGYRQMLQSITAFIPCRFKRAISAVEGTTEIGITKQQFFATRNAFYASKNKLNEAISRYIIDNIDEEVLQQTVQYVSEHINDILDETTKSKITEWISNYTDGKFVNESVYTSDKQSIQLYTKWQDEFRNAIGGSGMFTDLKKLFVGTSQVTFNADGTVRNIDKSGLVTDTQFAALTSRVQDAEGKMITEANIATYIEQEGDKFVSKATIYADKVAIQSGKNAKLGDYWKIDENGNARLQDLLVKNVTVEAAINNLINNVEAGSDMLISSSEAGQEADDYDSLDVLRLGNIIKIRVTNGRNIRLPYYITSSIQQRTYTKYGGTTHLMTADELRQLAGRKITIIVEASDAGHFIEGGFYLEPYQGSVKDAMNGSNKFRVPTFGDGGNAASFKLIPCVLQFELKMCDFFDANGVRQGYGYAWVCNSEQSTASNLNSSWT